jgi:hypothetical protein
VVQGLSSERDRLKQTSVEAREALRRSVEAHETEVDRLRLQLGEKEALVQEAANASAPLYMWPSADSMGALRSRYDQLHLAHTHLQAVVRRCKVGVGNGKKRKKRQTI